MNINDTTKFAEAIRTNEIESISITSTYAVEDGVLCNTIHLVLVYNEKLCDYLKEYIASKVFNPHLGKPIRIDYEDFESMDKTNLNNKLTSYYLKALIPGVYNEYSAEYEFVEELDNLGFYPAITSDTRTVKYYLQIRIFGTNYTLELEPGEETSAVLNMIANSCYDQLPKELYVIRIPRILNFIKKTGCVVVPEEELKKEESETDPLIGMLCARVADSAKHILPILEAPIKLDSIRRKGKYINEAKITKKHTSHSTNTSNWFPISKTGYDNKNVKELTEVVKEMKEVAADLKDEYVKLTNNYKIFKDKVNAKKQKNVDDLKGLNRIRH